MERSIAIVKDLLSKTQRNSESFREARFSLQNTPRTSEGFSPARLFYRRILRDPHLPQLQDNLDERAGRDSIQANKDKRKRRKNEEKKRLNTTPVELKPGMNMILQGAISKLWNIKGQVVSIRPGGQSAYIHVPEKNKTYLRNRRFIKVDMSLEYINEEDEDKEESLPALSVQQVRKVKKERTNNQSQSPTKTELSVKFSEFAFVGKRKVPIPTKLHDS